MFIYGFQEVHRKSCLSFIARLIRFPQIVDLLCDKVKCVVCHGIIDNPYRCAFPTIYPNLRLNHCSLDCRHVFCGMCVAYWFANTWESTCPECRVKCVALPQRDFVLREILPTLYSGLEREMPTYEALGTTLFARIYATIEACHRTDPQRPALSLQQQRALWAPILAEIRQMMGLDDPQPELTREPQPPLEPGRAPVINEVEGGA